MSRSRGKPPSQRQLRVGEELRHALVRVLARADFNDPDLADANITITQVQASPDLQNATAFVVPLGGARMRETVAALNRAAGFLRGQLSREVTLRHTPRIGFTADDSFERAAEIDRILDKSRLRQDLRPGGGRDEKDPDRGA
jgi:ribosome-binding factor A